MADRNGDEAGSSTFVLGVIVGAAIGAVVGVLFAPQAGSDARSGLFDRSEKIRGRARSLGVTGGDALRDAISEGRDAAGRARGEMVEWVRKTREGENQDSKPLRRSGSGDPGQNLT